MGMPHAQEVLEPLLVFSFEPNASQKTDKLATKNQRNVAVITNPSGGISCAKENCASRKTCLSTNVDWWRLLARDPLNLRRAASGSGLAQLNRKTIGLEIALEAVPERVELVFAMGTHIDSLEAKTQIKDEGSTLKRVGRRGNGHLVRLHR